MISPIIMDQIKVGKSLSVSKKYILNKFILGHNHNAIKGIILFKNIINRAAH